MNLRAQILLGWQSSGQPECLYVGLDGAALDAAHKAALKSKQYVAFRAYKNPDHGRPLPVTIDPTPIVVTAPVRKTFEVPAPKEQPINPEVQAANERRQAAADKDAQDLRTAREGTAFAELTTKSKAELTTMLEDLNSDLPDNQKVTPVPGAKKVDLINAILIAQGVKKPALTSEPKTENETA